jgi:uncharacterized protein (UPF0333 family)
MKMLNKKGQIVSNLQGFVMAIVTIGVILAIGLYVLQEMQYATTSDGTSTGTATAASNATGTIIEKLGNAPTWIGLLIVVVFASAILAYFYFRQ